MGGFIIVEIELTTIGVSTKIPTLCYNMFYKY